MPEFSKKAAVDIPSLFYWARPVDRDTTVPVPDAFEKQFLNYHGMAMSIRLAAQARCTPTTYNAGLRPISDAIRDNQRNSMVEYLVNQDELIRRGVIDADSLFEFFLVDVQMMPLVETSRIRQAISTIQLFVQRCFLGLESEYVPTDRLDRTWWEWMKNYDTWASNRKVFLYPENMIGPSLRESTGITRMGGDPSRIEADLLKQIKVVHLLELGIVT
ncbi:hypothetical protein LCI18_012716 [Fusarium solani-melongenae]|uniref:Uncharacterized protein n=1 Tax=Fusarium solani subsp. cucurbitae TaxID=2747967 RepID=A0ACD3ZLP2_FUSSC|nr:hypothetical protein LCI18_012716 [Fusarium solani-melongenae]